MFVWDGSWITGDFEITSQQVYGKTSVFAGISDGEIICGGYRNVYDKPELIAAVDEMKIAFGLPKAGTRLYRYKGKNMVLYPLPFKIDDDGRGQRDGGRRDDDGRGQRDGGRRDDDGRERGEGGRRDDSDDNEDVGIEISVPDRFSEKPDVHSRETFRKRLQQLIAFREIIGIATNRWDDIEIRNIKNHWYPICPKDALPGKRERNTVTTRPTIQKWFDSDGEQLLDTCSALIRKAGGVQTVIFKITAILERVAPNEIGYVQFIRNRMSSFID